MSRHKIGTFHLWLDGETVLTWLAARSSKEGRMTVEQERKAVGKQLNEQIIKDLKSMGFNNPKLAWSQYAGCSCGCSPGYNITVETPSPNLGTLLDWRMYPRNRDSYSITYYYTGKTNKFERRPGEGFSRTFKVKTKMLKGLPKQTTL